MKVQTISETDDLVFITEKINKQKEDNSDVWLSVYIFYFAANIFGLPALIYYFGYYYSALFLFICTLSICFLFAYYLKNIYYRNYYEKLLGDENHRRMEIEISEKGVNCTYDGNSSMFIWKNILEMEETAETIYFFTDCNGIAVRKTAFSSNLEYKEFVDFANNNLLINRKKKNDRSHQ